MLEVNSDGGEIFDLDLGLPDDDYFVDIGVDPVVASVRAYSGRPGLGRACRSRNGILTFVVPRVAPAEDYRALIVPTAGGPQTLTAVVFHARRRPIFSATHSLRRALPERRWLVGPSSPEAEEVP